jgi:AcrR family transcriptional regulator
MKVKANMRAPSHTAEPKAPRRRRGEVRVTALLESAAATFAEKGYAAATMTEIAARADAAIGSLYQFFPSKEALAAALLRRYGEWMAAGQAELVAQAQTMTPRSFADALVARRLALPPERVAVLAVMDAPGAAGERARFAEASRRSIALALKVVNPSLPTKRCRAMASVIIEVLKQVPALVQEDQRQHLGVLPELRELLAGYIGAVPVKRTRARAIR